MWSKYLDPLGYNCDYYRHAVKVESKASADHLLLLEPLAWSGKAQKAALAPARDHSSLTLRSKVLMLIYIYIYIYIYRYIHIQYIQIFTHIDMYTTYTCIFVDGVSLFGIVTRVLGPWGLCRTYLDAAARAQEPPSKPGYSVEPFEPLLRGFS